MKLWKGAIILIALALGGTKVSHAAYTSVLGAPVDSLGLCQQNLKIIVDNAIEGEEQVVETSCRRIEILNTDTEDLEVKFQPTALLETEN